MDDRDPVAPRRFHLTNRPLAKVRCGPDPQPVGRKPGGLWWALGSAWLDHVENPRSPGITRRLRDANRAYEVVLKPDARLLVIETAEDLMAVTLRYGVPVAHADPGRLSPMWQREPGGRWYYRPERDALLASHNRCSVGNLDWNAIARDYPGVEMRLQPGGPKSDRERTHFEWADIDWAVPSGCAWDTRILGKVVGVPMDALRTAQAAFPVPEEGPPSAMSPRCP
jgi:hypothetical protein